MNTDFNARKWLNFSQETNRDEGKMIKAGSELDKMTEEIIEGSLEAAVDAMIERGAVIGMNIVSNQPGRDDWMSPGWLVDLAREVLGEIDLDPCSTEEANQVIQAKTYYTKDMDGLSFTWQGKVFMNPPYSRGIMDNFVTKLCVAYDTKYVEEAFVITNNCTETVWAHMLFERMGGLCLPKGRIHFVLPGGKVATETRQGQMLWYLGKDRYHFASVMEDVGVILNKM